MPAPVKPEDLNPDMLVLVTGPGPEGAPCWAYASIPGDRLLAFRDAQQQASGYRLSDYGTVLKWGEGTEPPEEVKCEMERRYGADHRFEEKLDTLAEAVRQTGPESDAAT